MASAAEESDWAACAAPPSIAEISDSNKSARATPAIEPNKKSPDRSRISPPAQLTSAATDLHPPYRTSARQVPAPFSQSSAWLQHQPHFVRCENPRSGAGARDRVSLCVQRADDDSRSVRAGGRVASTGRALR